MKKIAFILLFSLFAVAGTADREREKSINELYNDVEKLINQKNITKEDAEILIKIIDEQ